MRSVRITLTEEQAAAMQSIVQRTGKTELEIIGEAVERFLEQQRSVEQPDRADSADLSTVREDSPRYLTSTQSGPLPLTAWRYAVEVAEEGHIELQVPLPPGSHIVVYVTEESPVDLVDDLLAAASTSLDFWDNALDDEDWNNA